MEKITMKMDKLIKEEISIVKIVIKNTRDIHNNNRDKYIKEVNKIIPPSRRI